MALDYIALRDALSDESKFPRGVCPVMSRMHIVIIPAPAGSLDCNSQGLKVVQQETFLAAPCIGVACALWNNGSCSMIKEGQPGG